jgi:hypothetical protein
MLWVDGEWSVNVNWGEEDGGEVGGKIRAQSRSQFALSTTNIPPTMTT